MRNPCPLSSRFILIHPAEVDRPPRTANFVILVRCLTAYCKKRWLGATDQQKSEVIDECHDLLDDATSATEGTGVQVGSPTLVAQSTSRVCRMAVPFGGVPAIDDAAGLYQAIEQNEKGPRPCSRGLTAFAGTGLSI